VRRAAVAVLLGPYRKQLAHTAGYLTLKRVSITGSPVVND
jgi:hypothetical protein